MEEIEAQVMKMEPILKSVIQKIQIKNDGEIEVVVLLVNL
jgi:hypothetical protein